MSRHQYDIIPCLKQPGTTIGKVCEKCEGRCPTCDSFVRPTAKVRICEECSFGKNGDKCMICGGNGITDGFYCYECVLLEKDRDGCPKAINIGSSRMDIHYEKKKQKQIQD